MSLCLKEWVISKQAGKLEIHYQPESCEIESNLVYTTLRVNIIYFALKTLMYILNKSNISVFYVGCFLGFIMVHLQLNSSIYKYIYLQ